MVALIGATLSIMSLITLITTSAPRGARFGIFIPLAMTSIGYIQSRRKFCLAYGFLGTFNFGKLGQLSKVADPVAKAADRRTALFILVQSLGLAALLTAVVMALPL